MRKLILFFILIAPFAQAQEYQDLYDEGNKEDFPYIEKPFKKGEELEYKLSYGIFTIGKGLVKVQPNTYNVNNRPTYKVDVKAKTVGMVGWVAKVDDHWGGYIDTTSLVPHVAFRNIKEGKYRKNEVVNYDHQSNMLEVKVIDKKTGKFKEPDYYEFPPQIRDLISGFSYFRAISFDTIQQNDTITVPAFFEDTFYNLKIIYLGKEMVETKLGEIRAHKVRPVMPENSIFDGEDAVLAWFSADRNKLPLKIEAKLFIGSGALELTSYKNVKYPVHFSND